MKPTLVDIKLAIIAFNLMLQRAAKYAQNKFRLGIH